ncbi:DUF3298 and DUF4163 domain-containing protein [Aquimarina litoralis]|uniref:DUF3298 and DUF4163 domain-containing protein n=1 Tax=Aquimarina litoralis TaxID=584605 RepID=UPI001C56ACA5|nr:DUF3298 and DUF4163 domain-containing protein [Aquimarina litoralis]
MSFQKKIVSIDDYLDCENTDCVITEVLLLESLADDDISLRINEQIEQKASSILDMDENKSLSNMEDALKSFNTSYQEIKKEFPEEIIPYEASINCDISFQNNDLLSVLIESYIFTGGAHGSGNSNYLNLDIKTGNVIQIKEIIKDHRGFQAFAEKVFRDTHAIPKSQSINSTGFFFENDTFYLPSNIGFTQDHIVLLYNQYEISSYADGPVELKLPKEEASYYISEKIL